MQLLSNEELRMSDYRISDDVIQILGPSHTRAINSKSCPWCLIVILRNLVTFICPLDSFSSVCCVAAVWRGEGDVLGEDYADRPVNPSVAEIPMPHPSANHSTIVLTLTKCSDTSKQENSKLHTPIFFPVFY